jgi:lysophospholipase L1-like esterase
MVANRANEDIQSLNALLKSLPSAMEIPYIDLFPHLVDGDGQLRIDYTVDRLHLNMEGYCVVLSVLKDYLE